MKFNRLVTFGDSFTYGQDMPDNERTWNRPSKHAWPAVVGKKLDIYDVLNVALPGASNKYIANTVLDFEFKKHDLVLILWSWHNRYHIFDNRKIYGQKIGTWNTRHNKTAEMYYRYLYNEADSIKQSLIYINHTSDYLKYKKIKNFHGLLDEDIRRTAETCSWNRTEFLPFRVNLVDYASDGLHPGKESHVQIARQMWINMKGQLRD